MDHETSHEAALLERAKRDPQAVGEIYDAYADRLYGFLFKRCAQKELSEDLLSKTFLKFLESLPTLEWRGVSLGAWLFRVASNLLTDHWRAASTRLDRPTDESEDFDVAAELDRPEFLADLALERDKLLTCLRELSPRDQEVLDLRFFGQREIPEIAATLGVSDNHASVLVYRSLARLKKTYVARFPSAASANSMTTV
jgi:RNA polymerase sigma-70 factor (ECF subfamily)